VAEIHVSDAGAERIEKLLMDLARVHQWTAMYAPGHPFLTERVGALHANLTTAAGREPSGVLLLGVARDKLLYQDRFFKARSPIVHNFTEELYRHHVATVGFGSDATPEGLASFFRCLRELQSGKIEEIAEGHLQRQGIRGIYLSPVNYKEVLSRGIAGGEPAADGRLRDEEMWRILLSSTEGDGFSEQRIVDELLAFPEALPAFLRRVRAGGVADRLAEPAEKSAATGAPPAEFIPLEALQRLFRRLGEKLKVLPEERQKKVLVFLEEGLSDGDGNGSGGDGGGSSSGFSLSVARSLADGYADSEFLDLLAGLVSGEGKGGNRLLRAFQVIAAGRDVERSLVPLLETWSREGYQTKRYYAGKTWEAVKRLLLDRSEESYLGEDHSDFLESLSGMPDRYGSAAEPPPEVDPLLGPFIDPKTVRRKGIVVLVDFLLQERQDEEILELLPVMLLEIPGLIEGKDFVLLDRLLDAVAVAREGDSAARREAASKALAAVNFRRIAEICLSGPAAVKNFGEGLDILVRYGARSADPLLDRLLKEPDKGMRRVLLSLLIRIGEPAVPAIAARLQDLPWFFLRNLCFILGEIGASGTVPGLVRMLAHKEQRVRREAIQALGKLRTTDPDAVSALGKILLAETLFASGKEEPVRIDAASALARIGRAEALSFLHRGKASRRAAVREHCQALLRTRGQN